jgi:Uma2 family endonuclease
MRTPSPLHQRLSNRLRRELEDYFATRGVAEVFNAPIDVVLAQQDIVTPHLVIVAVPSHASQPAVERVPLLVAEVISPATRAEDRGIKMRRSGDLGIPHYWIVDPDAQAIECRRLDGGAYRVVADPMVPETLRHPDWPDLSIDLAALWQ